MEVFIKNKKIPIEELTSYQTHLQMRMVNDQTKAVEESLSDLYKKISLEKSKLQSLKKKYNTLLSRTNNSSKIEFVNFIFEQLYKIQKKK